MSEITFSEVFELFTANRAHSVPLIKGMPKETLLSLAEQPVSLLSPLSPNELKASEANVFRTATENFAVPDALLELAIALHRQDVDADEEADHLILDTLQKMPESVIAGFIILGCYYLEKQNTRVISD